MNIKGFSDDSEDRLLAITEIDGNHKVLVCFDRQAPNPITDWGTHSSLVRVSGQAHDIEPHNATSKVIRIASSEESVEERIRQIEEDYRRRGWDVGSFVIGPYPDRVFAPYFNCDIVVVATRGGAPSPRVLSARLSDWVAGKVYELHLVSLCRQPSGNEFWQVEGRYAGIYLIDPYSTDEVKRIYRSRLSSPTPHDLLNGADDTDGADVPSI